MTERHSTRGHSTEQGGTGQRWMIYGCNGYTGRLVVEQARALGMTPILAGRRAEAVEPLARQAGLAWRTFRVDDPVAADAALADVDVLLVAAGPFSATSAPLLDACLRTGTAYLDVNGDVEVLAATFARRDEVADRGGLAVPSVGFDVAPSDCLVALVCAQLPGPSGSKSPGAVTSHRAAARPAPCLRGSRGADWPAAAGSWCASRSPPRSARSRSPRAAATRSACPGATW